MAGASSHISEEMIELSFFNIVFPGHEGFTLFFRNHFLCFLLPGFFFLKVQSKIGVRIIHGRTLYTGKDGIYIYIFIKFSTLDNAFRTL